MDISLPRMTGVVSSAFPSSPPSLLLRQEQDVRNREGGAEERNLKIPQIAVEPILNHYIEQRFGRALTEYNEDGETPLMEAVLSRDETSIFLILFHLANVKNGRRDDNNNNSNNRRRNNYNNTYLSDDKEEADVEGGVVDDNNDVDDDDDKLLHVDPCYCPILNAKSLATGQTALHLACGIFGASNAIVELLLDNGCNLYETDLLGRTPLHISCSQYGSESLVRLLLESSSSSKNKRKKNKKQQDDKEGDDGYDFINTLDKTGSSPLHAATRKYNTNIVNLLLRQGAKLNSFDSYGCTPLHEASMLGFESIVSTMLTVGGTHTINIKTKKGDNLTPLQLATIFGHELVVRQLLHHGASIHVTNNLGETPLHVVSCRGYTKIAKLLLENNATTSSSMRDSNKKTRVAEEEFKSDIDDIINMQCTTNMNTPLHLAAIRDEYEMAKLLLDHGASTNSKDTYGYTPYERAIRCCSFGVARLLKLQMEQNEEKRRRQQQADDDDNTPGAMAGEKQKRRNIMDDNNDNRNRSTTLCNESRPNKRSRNS